LIDLHCHILPSVDDGARNLSISLEMARIAVADGITVTACTPHIFPGVYDNTGPAILAAVEKLSGALAEAGIPLQLISGADVQMDGNIVSGLANGGVLTLGGSRYVLLEPPHHVAPPRLEQTIFSLSAAGYVPMLTHPERLTWIDSHFDMIQRLARRGMWIQITAGSLTGRFGRDARYWAERLLDDSLVHVLATDAHDARRRPPLLAEAYQAAAKRVGEDEAKNLVLHRPQAVLQNADPPDVLRPLRAKLARRATMLWRWGTVGRLGG
jgi:protein-tyrosine phosphatase